MSLDAHDASTHRKLNALRRRLTHRDSWYVRSGHLSYARAGVPALMYATLVHTDYDTPGDDSSHIDAPRFARTAQKMWPPAATSGNT